MKKNKIRTFREELGLTQAELAEQTNLSIRTIQRLESGESIPKGHTLKVLSEKFKVNKNELLPDQPVPSETNSKKDINIKLINLSCLCFIGIPFGNIFIPLHFWKKYRADELTDKVGSRIINFQIIWTICTCLILILSPFLQEYFPYDFSLMLGLGLTAVGINLYFISKTAISLNHSNYDVLPLKLRFL